MGRPLPARRRGSRRPELPCQAIRSLHGEPAAVSVSPDGCAVPAVGPSDPRQPEYWEQRYTSGDTRWDKGAPSPGLVDFLRANPDLPRGRVLVPGCGVGHDVFAWAQAGFAAVGVDFAPSAIRQAVQQARSLGLKPTFSRRDFLRDSPARPFDWVFEHTLFCAIPPMCRTAYSDAVRRWLRPGGDFLAVHYMLCEPTCPPWPVSREEIERRFRPDFDLLADWLPRSHPNRAGREWMFWWRRKCC